MTEESVGVVGLGRMGMPILRRLAHSYPGLASAHDADATKQVSAVASGATWYPALSDLARTLDVVITVLPGPEELRSAFTAVLPALQPGALWIDLTSGDPRLTEALAAEADRRGVDVVSAPMAGSVTEAETQSLVFYVGGGARAVARATPYLTCLAVEGGVRRVGERPQDGQILKLLANALWFAHALAAGEALLLGTALGLEAGHLGRLLRDSAGGSTFTAHHLDDLLAGDYLETFALSRVVEELETVASLALTTGTKTRLLDVSVALHRAASDRYGSDLGELLGVRYLEDEAHRQLRGAEDGGV